MLSTAREAECQKMLKQSRKECGDIERRACREERSI